MHITQKNTNSKDTHRRSTHMSSNKTPFEIRADILELAYRILYNNAMTTAKGYDPKAEYPHEHITTEQVMAEAVKLNKFVSNNNTHETNGKGKDTDL